MIEVLGASTAVLALLSGLGRLLIGAWRASQRITRVLDSVERTERVVAHHLGPNGSSTPLHSRVARLERGLGVGVE